MFNNEINTTSSPVIINSLQALFNYIDMWPDSPFLPNSSIYDYEEFKDILEIFEDIYNEEYLDLDDQMYIEHSRSSSTSRTSSFDYPEVSPSSIISKSSDNQDGIFFDPTEWSIETSSTKKIRPPRLHEFLRLVLDNPRYTSYISWLNKNEGLFKIHQPTEVVNLWGKVKLRQTNGTMDYDKFARAIRCYYKDKIMIATHKKHTHRFASNN